ncbi:acyltransferase [Jiangella alkaliphila]|uniref:Acetyltransferase (Isoleucine patch superfamily) n=1 Tax=Jiangella alkaliphila TaxID=419479 RepID=A0A1H2JL87_9ACTN|nr:acyltransferase [Jiangella alkaliphila]SDU57239.1 Acetyltransferase (isoleucine patch superfamily) [Jiangella alkaliphila]
MPPPSNADRFDVLPWEFAASATSAERAEQASVQAGVAGDTSFGPDVYVSPRAAVFPRRLVLGARSYVAAHVYLTDDVELGADCTLNPYAVARGRIVAGDGVRVGAHTSLLGFSHGMAPDAPVFRQPVTSRGISIGDDVWIGSHVVVVDGVRIGSHAVVGAGSVVTRHVPDWAVVAGNPARVVRDRRALRTGGSGLESQLAAFGARVHEQAADVLARYWTPAPAAELGGRFAETPGAAPTVRAWCDAVEIADLLLGAPPPQVDGAALAAYLRSLQQPDTGLVPEYGRPASLDDSAAAYHVLSVGYALSLLGSRFAHPVAVPPAAELVARLDALPWAESAWAAGAWVDTVGTALHRNRADAGVDGPVEALFGWLLTRADPAHGMWGRPSPPPTGWHEVVNGFYRLTRGTFAQFGLPLPYPERAVDTVLAHAADPQWFGPDRGTACDVLDVVHPLLLTRQQTAHRRSDGDGWVRQQLDRALRGWVDGAGFSFELTTGASRHRTPSLFGTEMWLAIVWLLANHLGESDALGYRPRGVHRPEPAAAVRAPSAPGRRPA